MDDIVSSICLVQIMWEISTLILIETGSNTCSYDYKEKPKQEKDEKIKKMELEKH